MRYRIQAVLLVALALLVLPPTAAHALRVKVSINAGPTITGPDNGTLIVTANPGDLLTITWALGSDTDIDRYTGLVSEVDTAEITRVGGSALELTGQGFDPCCNPNAPDPGEFGFFAASDGAPVGHSGNGGELWRIEYIVANPATDETADITFWFDEFLSCQVFPGGLCSGTPGIASLRIDAVPPTPVPAIGRVALSLCAISILAAGGFVGMSSSLARAQRWLRKLLRSNLSASPQRPHRA